MPLAQIPGEPAAGLHSDVIAVGLSTERLYRYRDEGLLEQLGRGPYRRANDRRNSSSTAGQLSTTRTGRLQGGRAHRHQRHWRAHQGSKPAALIEMARPFRGSETAVRHALEVVL